jgi:hypothetical protein
MKKKLMYSIPFLALAALAAVGITVAQEGADSENAQHRHEKTFTVDAAIDGGGAVWNSADPKLPPGSSRGDTVVADGTIYRTGTLPRGLANNDPNAPGGIGKIRCRGALLVPATDFTSLAFTYVTELYLFPDDTQSVLADGQAPNLFFSLERPVLGGTGRFKNVSGQLHEENLGTNSTGGCNLRVTFKLSKPRHDNDRDHD